MTQIIVTQQAGDTFRVQTPAGTSHQVSVPTGFAASLGCGKEMALHGEIAEALGMPVFFCEPHSPWQRPASENTNGLLRQYFPKGTDLRVHAPGQLTAVAAELSARPRKTLGWNTPEALLAAALRQGSHS
jgi:IS30 family transposase